MKTIHRLRIGTAILAVVSLASARASELKIGDPAPKLKTGRWLKGTPIPKFEKGKVYVIEFWATWCGPCKVAMPHLSAMAKKYAGKATFVGVNIWEDQHAAPGENLDAKVDKFMNESGNDVMAYNVCAGSKDGYMAKNWMSASGQGGIPATFIVDADSKIAWIGHPIYVEEPLGKIIEGSFNAKAFATEFEARRKASEAREKITAGFMAPIRKAMAAKKYDEAAAACDRAIAKDPVFKMVYAISKFEALMHDPEKAYAEAIKVQDDWEQAYMAAQQFVMKDGLDRKFYQYTLELGQARHKAHPEEGNRLNLIAKAHARLGDYAKAVEFQTRFVEWAKSIKLDPANMKDLEAELQKYKDAVGK